MKHSTCYDQVGDSAVRSNNCDDERKEHAAR